MQKLKLLLVGLSGSGKTAIANFLSESVEMEALNELRPTKGVRILEFDSPDVSINGSQTRVEIELWDCSGDHRYETCWPALRANAHGVIFVCSFNNISSAPREFDVYYEYFVAQPGLSAKQCVVFYNTMDMQQDTKGLKLSPTFSKVSQVSVNISEGGNKLRNDFANYVVSVVMVLNA